MDRRLLFQDARVRETGQDKEFNDSFPPVGHLLIWYDKEQQEITLPLNRSPVFLKVVAMKNKYLCTATMQGGDYPQVPLGDYEFIIEFGSKSEALRQTTKRFQFTADLNGKLSGNILEDITLPNPDKEGSQSE